MAESVWNDGENMADQVRGLLMLLREVAHSSVTNDYPGVGYVEVQIDPDTWQRITGMFPAAPSPPEASSNH